jgi:hypothetical protein
MIKQPILMVVPPKSSGIDVIARIAVKEKEGNSIILTYKVEQVLQGIYQELCNSSIAYKRTDDGIQYSTGSMKTISVHKITMSTWGVEVGSDIQSLFIHNVDLIHPKITQRLIYNKTCDVIMTSKTVIDEDFDVDIISE